MDFMTKEYIYICLPCIQISITVRAQPNAKELWTSKNSKFASAVALKNNNI